MRKFKVGDVVYDVRLGIAKINNYLEGEYPISIDISRYSAYTDDGKFRITDKHPILLTLEEALHHKFITQAEYDEHNSKKKKRHVIYREDGRDGFTISADRYSSKEEFLQKNYSEFKFVGFLLPSEVVE